MLYLDLNVIFFIYHYVLVKQNIEYTLISYSRFYSLYFLLKEIGGKQSYCLPVPSHANSMNYLVFADYYNNLTVIHSFFFFLRNFSFFKFFYCYRIVVFLCV